MRRSRGPGLALGLGMASCSYLAGIDGYRSVPCVEPCAEPSTTDGAVGVASAEDAASASPAKDERGPKGPPPSPNDGRATTCASTKTVESCSECGRACDAQTANAVTCDGKRCHYVCKPGRTNCNTAPPDLDGCECLTPRCCGAACETIHANGVGESFYDCAPQGTYDAVQARAACEAHAALLGGLTCAPRACQSETDDTVCVTELAGDLTRCTCWSFAGPHAGRVLQAATCTCPGPDAGTWN